MVVFKAWEKLSPNLGHLSHVPLVLVNNSVFPHPTGKLHSRLSLRHAAQQPSGCSSTAIPFAQLNKSSNSVFLTAFLSFSVFCLPAEQPSFLQLLPSYLRKFLCFLSPSCPYPIPLLSHPSLVFEKMPLMLQLGRRGELFRPFCHGERKL